MKTTFVNRRRTKTIAESKIKTDKLDAETIAHWFRTGFIATALNFIKRGDAAKNSF